MAENPRGRIIKGSLAGTKSLTKERMRFALACVLVASALVQINAEERLRTSAKEEPFGPISMNSMNVNCERTRNPASGSRACGIRASSGIPAVASFPKNSFPISTKRMAARWYSFSSCSAFSQGTTSWCATC